MARKLKDQAAGASKPAPKDHNNGPLSDEDEAALHAYFRHHITAKQKAAAEIKAKYDSAREEVNSEFARVKAELKVSRKDFEGMMALAAMSDAEFRMAETKRTRLFLMNGLPVGAQLSLDLGAPADTATEQQDAYNHGFRASEEGPGIPPDFISPILHQDWMRGWTDGQAKLISKLGRAAEILAARAAPTPEPAPEEPEPEFDEKAAARKLRNDPAFMDRAAPAEAIEPQPAEGYPEPEVAAA